MLQSVGLYRVKGEVIEIRLPNPNDVLINWSMANDEFKKEFISFWHQTYVLSQKREGMHHAYGISKVAYRNLIVLDHIAYQVNAGLISENMMFDDAYDHVSQAYDNALRLMTSV